MSSLYYVLPAMSYLSISHCAILVFLLCIQVETRGGGKDKIAKVALYVSSCLPRPYSLSLCPLGTHTREQ